MINGSSSRAPGLVLVHGANREGKHDPRVIGLADAFARAGRERLVPQLALAGQRLDRSDLDRIADAIDFLARRGETGVLAFSYGAGLVLVTLEERPALQERVSFVATVGTYFDLLHLIQGATTGTVPYRDRTLRWRADPMAREVAAEQLADLLQREGGRPSSAPGSGSPRGARSGCPAGLRPARQPGSGPGVRACRGLTGRGENPAAPPSESKLLVEALAHPRSRFVEVIILRHVTPLAWPLLPLRDGLSLARCAGLVLAAQEGWPRP